MHVYIMKGGLFMKKGIASSCKKIIAVLLTAMLIFGAVPIRPVADLFDVSLSASAVTWKSGPYVNFSVGDWAKPGEAIVNTNTATLLSVYINGSKKATVQGSQRVYYLPSLSGYQAYRCSAVSKDQTNNDNCYIKFTTGDYRGNSSVTTAPTGLTKVYNGSPQTLVTAGASTGGTIQYRLDGTDWSTSLPTGTNVGTYTVYYRIPESSSYKGVAAKTVQAKITKAPISPTISVSDVEYPNQPSPSVSGNPGGGTKTFYYSTSATGSFTTTKPTAIGNYYVYATVGETANYLSGQTPVAPFKITSRGIQVTAPTPKTLTYNGDPQTLADAGTTSYGTMEYSLDGTDYSTTLPKGTNAGDYPIYYKVVGDGIVFEPKIINSKINKADPNVTPPVGKDLRYNGNYQILVTPASTDAGTLQYSLDGEHWSEDIPKGKETGEYTIYYRVLGNENYNDVPPRTVRSTISDENMDAQKKITVLNIAKEDEPVVTAYQVIKGRYVNGKLSEYVLNSELGSLTISDMEKPTEDEITAIAAAIRSGSIHLPAIPMTRSPAASDAETVSYTADAEPGLYVVVVTDSTKAYIYNPAIVAVNVTDPSDVAGSMVGGTVDMMSYFNFPTRAYIKSSKVSLKKSIIDDNGNKTKGASAAYGDTVRFRIDDVALPSYSHDYTDPVFRIKDTLEGTAFTGISGFKLTVGGTEVSPSSTTYTITAKDKSGAATAIDSGTAVSFTVDFKASFIEANESKAVVIDYSSVIANTAGYNYSENQNTAELEYSNSPETISSYRDTTYHYTFGISAKIDGEDTENPPIIPGDIVKVSEESDEFERITAPDGTIIYKNKKALPGAGFGLYTDYSCNAASKAAETISDEYGLVSFTGLDAGVYFLKETTPPEGYTLKASIYRIEIDPEFDDRGVLTTLSIKTYTTDNTGAAVELVEMATYTNTSYTVNDDGSVTNDIDLNDDAHRTLSIINTKLAELPSTGGAGTILLTVISSLGMAIFLAVFINSKRKRKIDEE